MLGPRETLHAHPESITPPAWLKSHHSATIDLVRQFHLAFGHPVAKQLTTGDAKLRRLRVLLVAQELAEMAQAAGVPLRLIVQPVRLLDPATFTEKQIMNGMVKSEWVAPAEQCYGDNLVDLVELADALGDLDVVVQGGNLAFGIPAGEVMNEIHASNMSKLGEDGKPIYNADGKIMKGPNFKEPAVKRVLETFDPQREL